jgi:hypothetical protein
LGVVMLSAAWYFLISLLHHIEILNSYARLIKIIQYAPASVFLVLGMLGSFLKFFELRTVIYARKANQKVAEVLDTIKDSPGKNVADISTQDVTESIKDTKVSDAQLVRLVEQRKQQLLIDDEYFRDELNSLIVDYLQPLPRNAKRLLNRFRVNLLVAHSRGLFTSDPKVTAQQIGKWLVLMERWPQLGRSLSANTNKIQILEKQSKAPQSLVASESATGEQDPFMESIRLLAPSYFGDEDLRLFIHSEPVLAIVLSRLVHYGAATLKTE